MDIQLRWQPDRVNLSSTMTTKGCGRQEALLPPQLPEKAHNDQEEIFITTRVICQSLDFGAGISRCATKLLNQRMIRIKRGSDTILQLMSCCQCAASTMILVRFALTFLCGALQLNAPLNHFCKSHYLIETSAFAPHLCNPQAV